MFYIFLGLLSGALFGAATPLGKAVIQSFGPFQLAGILYLGAAAGVMPFALKNVPKPLIWGANRTNLLRLIVAIICGGIIAPIFLLKGLFVASATSVSLWLPLEMAATAVLGALFFHDHLGVKGWAGMAGVVTASVLLVIGEPLSGLMAGCYIFLACLFWGIDNNLTALIDNLTPAQSTFWKGLIAGTVNLTIGWACQPWQSTHLLILYALMVGALCYGASIMLYITSAQNIGASRAQMLFATNPFFGIAIATFVLGEPITVIRGLAALLISISLAIILFSKHSHAHIHSDYEHLHHHVHNDCHHNHNHEGISTGLIHIHKHKHDQLEHIHPHWPDLHHRHKH